MPVITKIEVQKNNKDRVNIYVDNKYAFAAFIDTIINDNKEYINSLWNNDPNISQLITQFLKKQEILQEQKADKKRAKEQGLSDVQISDKDYADGAESQK